jgi:anthranilate phosphoribosyltransferase
MKEFLQKLISGESLSELEAEAAVSKIAAGETSEIQTAAFLTAIQQKGVHVNELKGFRKAMLAFALKLDFGAYDAIDVCGTGGDGKDTFNISTTAAFIVAGAGQKVAKHGNHGVSSSVGSSTVLEQLGVHFTNDEHYLRTKIENAGICYLHAPLFHPAMKYVGPVRKALGIKTVFNILGPLLNPVGLKFQLSGVSDLNTFKLYSQLFEESDMAYGIVHALDGYDEISLTGAFQISTKSGTVTLEPADIGLQKHSANELIGGNDLEKSAKIIIDVLNNKGTIAQTEAVLANAGLALSIAKNIDFKTGLVMAQDSLKSGKAAVCLQKLIND